MESKKTYNVMFVKYFTNDGATKYLVKVVDTSGKGSFHILDRYSSMRRYWCDMKEEYGKEALPEFPPKKWFGNKNPDFIKTRKERLEHFFSQLLKDPKLASCEITQRYFDSHKYKAPSDIAGEREREEDKKEEIKKNMQEELKRDEEVKKIGRHGASMEHGPVIGI